MDAWRGHADGETRIRHRGTTISGSRRKPPDGLKGARIVRIPGFRRDDCDPASPKLRLLAARLGRESTVVPNEDAGSASSRHSAGVIEALPTEAGRASLGWLSGADEDVGGSFGSGRAPEKQCP